MAKKERGRGRTVKPMKGIIADAIAKAGGRKAVKKQLRRNAGK